MDCAQSHSCRDFVDYDSNLIAVAHQVGTVAQGKQVLKRIDHGCSRGANSRGDGDSAQQQPCAVQKCSAMYMGGQGGPQWTSEIWYGKHDTTSGNIGDSSSAMGRIAWFDAKARKVVGDVQSFDTQLAVMQKDLLFYTWMHERYGCDGTMQTNRTAAVRRPLRPFWRPF
jgi:hypothetical protein